MIKKKNYYQLKDEKDSISKDIKTRGRNEERQESQRERKAPTIKNKNKGN